MEKIDLILLKLDEILAALKTQTPVNVEEKPDARRLTLEELRTVTRPFVEAKITTDLKTALQELGVTCTQELVTRVNQNLFLAKCRILREKLPAALQAEVFSALSELEKII